MKLFNKITAVVLAGVMSIIGFSGCSSSENELDKIKEAGKLVVYTKIPFPPYEFQTPEGEIVGVDVEIGQAIADELGVDLEIVPVDFDEVIPAVESGKCDIGISGISITYDRAQYVDFSVPYYSTSLFLIVPTGSEINSIEDLASKEVGVESYTTTSYSLIQNHNTNGILAQNPCNLHTCENISDMILELKEGNSLDAIVIDSPIAQFFVNADSNYTIIPLQMENGPIFEESNGIAVAKGNEDLLEIINSVINEMIENEEIDRLFNDYAKMANETLNSQNFNSNDLHS